MKLILKTRRPILIKVCNAIETGSYKPLENGSWIEYWQQEYSKRSSSNDVNELSACCQNPNCQYRKEEAGRNINGAHVVSISGKDPELYILPLCDGCNGEKGDLAPFIVKLGKCIPIPNKCIYDDGSGNPYEIDNAKERIMEANEEYVKEKKRQ